MPTKTLKFDDETLEIIRAMLWSNDGLQVVITAQLDRAQYQKVNTAIEAMGGKWVRAKKAHVFETDPRPAVEGLLADGSLTVEKDGFFETPPAIVAKMIEAAQIGRGMTVLEPSAGLGAIVRGLLPKRADVRCIEKNQQRALKIADGFFIDCVIADFLTITPSPMDRVVMNPPFEEGQDIEHVRHAYNFLKPDGILVAIMSEGPFFRNDRRAVEFRAWLDDVGGESEQLPPGSFKESGTGVNARMVVIRNN